MQSLTWTGIYYDLKTDQYVNKNNGVGLKVNIENVTRLSTEKRGGGNFTGDK